MRVLLVEHESEAAEAMGRSLEEASYTVEVAANGMAWRPCALWKAPNTTW